MYKYDFLKTTFARFAQAIDTLILMHYESQLEQTAQGIAHTNDENPHLLSIPYAMSSEEQEFKIKRLNDICHQLNTRLDRRAQKYNID